MSYQIGIQMLRENGLELPWGCQGIFPIKLEYESLRKMVWNCPGAAVLFLSNWNTNP